MIKAFTTLIVMGICAFAIIMMFKYWGKSDTGQRVLAPYIQSQAVDQQWIANDVNLYKQLIILTENQTNQVRCLIMHDTFPEFKQCMLDALKK